MLLSEPDTKTSSAPDLKLEPQVKPPHRDILQALAPEDQKLLTAALEDTIEYVPHELLEGPDAERIIMRPVPADGTVTNADDSGLCQLSDQNEGYPDLDREHQLFLQLNYTRQRVHGILERFEGKRLNAEGVGELLRWVRAVHRVRDQIISENMPLVMAMAKRTRITGVDPADLISEGNLALLRAAKKFDCSRGYKFSTYACRAILKSFSRVATRTSRYRGHFPVEFDPQLEKSNFVERQREDVEDRCKDELRNLLDDQLSHLSEVERTVIKARFALDQPDPDPSTRGKTLEQVGELIGVTKERVRQIQNKALGKLRVALNESVLA
jgi:RNA polymerase primary sigma factor